MARGSKPGERRGGRAAGVPNSSTPDIKALARKYGDTCITELVNIAKLSKNEGNRLAAIDQLLNRAYGKPSQQVDHGNADDKPFRFTLDLGRD